MRSRFLAHGRHAALAAAAGLLLLAAGCGGGGGGDFGRTPTTGTNGTTGNANTLPASATASSSGLLAYLAELIANRTDETSEPIALGDAVLPTDDTAPTATTN